MISRLHAGAAWLAFSTIAVFWFSTLISEIWLAPTAVAAVKLGILCGIPVLIAAMAVAGVTGARLARQRSGVLVSRKRRRLPFAAVNGAVILVPCAWVLYFKASAFEFDQAFYGVQATELLAGAVNLTLLGLNLRDGLRLAGKLGRGRPGAAPRLAGTGAGSP